MQRVVLSLFLSSAALAASPPPPVTDAALPPVLRFTHPLGDAFLLRPASCAPACPLVVVSHSRGMSAELSLTRPHLRSLFARLTEAGYAVLISNDAGPTTWGAPQALTYLADMHARAVRTFPFNGHTYNFGYSMGGLPALLTAYKGVYPVSGVILLDAQVNLLDVWRGSNATFSAEVTASHGLNGQAALPPGRDPYHDFAGQDAAQLPLLVAGSAEDQVVAFTRNGEALYARSASPESRLLRLTGPHLGASHFGDALVSGMLAFLNRLEHAGPLVHQQAGTGR
ncbi:alpha/beta hydrolase (plasmid) [Deinococcus metallilatus]|uniref:Alpha/beta hydrolase n=1 Tax=Deinococcus metallilatus TaxID=1211322 RepID=A0ABR6MV24_9DEIO|nr:alpha/beta hydrolase [Deinococcus metallilatus]MBB5295770.1 hypothetical protein [Deinococcus metallilatus]QBY06792.1 alpha/beta hydrolase [Deinococcus metallilatus]GMA14299.1 alpha/beta hydrolase [Deinococcus metallilatus]